MPNVHVRFLAPMLRARSTTTRDRNLQFRVAVSTGFFELSPGSLCNLERKSAQNVEKVAGFQGGDKRVESCHVCGGCHVFFSGPDIHVMLRHKSS